MSTSKLSIPNPSEIRKVKILIGRFEVYTTAGDALSFRFNQLTDEQEDALRGLAQPFPKRRNAPKRRHSGKPSKRVNYAALGVQ